VLVLRLRSPHGREYKVPLNLRIARHEIPLGLIAITAGLTALCLINLLTKEVATLAGLAFTIVFFATFTVTERLTRRTPAEHTEMDQFNLNYSEALTPESLGIKPEGVLVAINNPNALEHLESALDRYDTHRHGVCVLFVRVMQRAASGEHGLEAEQLFGGNEQYLFSRALAIAEKRGKPIHPAVVAANDLSEGVLRTAQSLQSSFIVLGHSSKWSEAEQARQIGLAWERLPEPKSQAMMEIVEKAGTVRSHALGPHQPVLTPKEVKELHELWLRCSREVAPLELHHHDLVHFALEEIQRELGEGKEEEVLRRLRKHVVLAHATQ